MSNPDQMNQALQTTKPISMKELIETYSKEIGQSLPEHMRSERLIRIALTCIRQTPDLAKCTPESFLGSLFTAAQLGVEPIAGRAYLLPFNNSKEKPDGTWHTVKEAQFVLGYKGVVDLFYRHEKTINLAWGIRRENDAWSMTLGTNARLSHTPADDDRGGVLGYWVMAHLINGGQPFHYMTLQECTDHGKNHSKTWDKKNNKFYDNSPWVKDFDAMALKTVLIQLAKILPLSIEMQRAIEADESSRSMIPDLKVDNILDIPNEMEWNTVEKEVKKDVDINPEIK